MRTQDPLCQLSECHRDGILREALKGRHHKGIRDGLTGHGKALLPAGGYPAHRTLLEGHILALDDDPGCLLGDDRSGGAGHRADP